MNNNTKETLLILMEECGEVTQAVSKCFRFGTDGTRPGDHRTNLQHLEDECGDLLCMIDLLVDSGFITEAGLAAAKARKLERLARWSQIDTTAK